MFNGIKGVYYRELMVLKSRWIKTILSSSISPMLFLIAFGYGLGKNANINGVNYMAFLIPGLIAMSSMNQSYGVSTEINISRFYFKVFDEYLLAPVRRWEIIAGEILYGITKGLIPVVIIFIYAILVNSGIKITFLFIFAIILHLIIFALIGFIVALIVKNHGDQVSVNTFVMTPMIFLSGTFYPVEKMPALIKIIASIFPLTYSVKLIRYSLIGGDENPFNLVVILFFIMTLLYMLALSVVKRVEI
jgi:Nod factor-specific ABC transporter NodJ protein